MVVALVWVILRGVVLVGGERVPEFDAGNGCASADEMEDGKTR